MSAESLSMLEPLSAGWLPLCQHFQGEASPAALSPSKLSIRADGARLATAQQDD